MKKRKTNLSVAQKIYKAKEQRKKDLFMYTTDSVFDLSFQQLIMNYSATNRRDRGYFWAPAIKLARKFMYKKNQRVRKQLVEVLMEKEKLTPFQVLEVLKFIDFYREKRKEALS